MAHNGVLNCSTGPKDNPLKSTSGSGMGCKVSASPSPVPDPEALPSTNFSYRISVFLGV